MLALSRKIGEGIRIGDNIQVTIVKTGHRVKIGIEAPDTVRVLRSELDNWSELSFESPSSSAEAEAVPATSIGWMHPTC